MMANGLTMQERRPLKHNRSFITLMAAQAISNLGDWLHLLAILTLVGIRWNATPWEITFTTLCAALPVLLTGPFAGALADRVNRKWLMIGADGARIVIVGGLIFADQIWHVYVLLILKSLFDVVFSPAKNGKLKEIVPQEQLGQAVSISSVIEQMSKIIGPALGGLLVAAFGITWCFVLDSASFLISGIILLWIPGARVIQSVNQNVEQVREETAGVAPAGKKATFMKDTMEGIRMLASLPHVGTSLVLLASALLFLQFADSQTVVLFRQLPGISSDLLGWCVAASGVGTLIAAMSVQKWKKAGHVIKMGLGTSLMGLVIGGVGMIVGVWPHAGLGANLLLISLFALAGVGVGFAIVPFQILLQEQTPESMTGRVFGTVGSIMTASNIMGPVVGGFLVTSFGVIPAFISSGILLTLLGVIYVAIRRRKKNDMDGSLTANYMITGE
ncbi:MFS transporter [Paenibacillus sp. AD87]|uniref:MFS transporter n=2 Tax=unclassified Paenibacillus TaxID=185978 RepID=UPI00080000F0|nr:MFS transporter [Paenibacillus sp. AD87]OAX45166.1 putative bacilysin exporter BacE [Paenibacillus sp. AD87]SDL66985.1 Predicted arabinose efflux permease, MFS family [Paenibacillus sp. OK060]